MTTQAFSTVCCYSEVSTVIISMYGAHITSGKSTQCCQGRITLLVAFSVVPTKYSQHLMNHPLAGEDNSEQCGCIVYTDMKVWAFIFSLKTVLSPAIP